MIKIVLILIVIFAKMNTAAIIHGLKYEPRIKNGIAVDETEKVPYIALIQVKDPHSDEFLPVCTGALISSEDILTNAVCATACNITENCKVFVGTMTSDGSGTKVNIIETVWHETFVGMYMVRWPEYGIKRVIDLGILHTEPIKLTSKVNVINLPGRELINGFDVTVAGFGSGEIDNQTKTLQYANITATKCFDNKTGNQASDARYACFEDDKVWACTSDMGATMIQTDGSNELIAIGSHFTYWNCDKIYSRFTRVFRYCSWIQEHMIYSPDEEPSSASTFTGIFMTIIATTMIVSFI